MLLEWVTFNAEYHTLYLVVSSFAIVALYPADTFLSIFKNAMPGRTPLSISICSRRC